MRIIYLTKNINNINHDHYPKNVHNITYIIIQLE